MSRRRKAASPPSETAVRQPTAVRERTLSRSQVVDKQVITRTSGLQLGVISHFLVDPRTVSVIFLHLRAKGLGGQEVGVVELSALTQIADVVLVHDESALEDELRSRGLVKLVGYSVQAYDGTPLGKVRDFMFSPDTGRITHLSYDTFGLPTIPEALLNVYEVDAEAVLEVRSGLVVLKRGAERAVVLVSTGLLGYALDKAKDVFDMVKGEDDGEGQLYIEGMDEAFMEWRRSHGAEWARYYGLRELPSSRAQVDMITRSMQNALPPPRQTAELPRREPATRPTARDPRTRRTPYSSTEQRRPGTLGAEAGQALPPRRQQPAAAAASTSASVPIIDMRPREPFRRRDVDGRYGDAPVAAPPQQVQEEAAGPGVPFDQFVVREPAATRVPQMETYGDFQQPVRADQASASGRERYLRGYQPDPIEGPRVDSRETMSEEERSDRATAIRRDLSDWRLQKADSEVYQYRDANIPRMRRH
ncbi:hypothetical protein COCOBI_08-1440 [Coccomyxa sp. Obi]|nr:hypothetical protein COCOBI_08-1440 [Coccomyxa sp. Obi]